MASKIITDDPNHHKYVVVNKKERKKKKITPIFNHIYKIYTLAYNHITELLCLISHNNHYRYNEQPPYHGVKGCKIVYDDCNHKTYRVIKNGKFIKAIYKDRKYGTRYIREKHFKRNVYKF